jgi:hypoxanthine-guanine phosphoribosyltransferase
MPLRILLTEDQIQKRIKELGAQIDADYPTGPMHLV